MFMKSALQACLCLQILFGIVPAYAADVFNVSPSQLVVGVGGKIQIDLQSSSGTTFSTAAKVMLDSVQLPTNRLTPTRLEATIYARKFWYGPKRIVIKDGAAEHRLDGLFELSELRPYGTKVIMYDFEDNPPPGRYSYESTYRGRAQYHDFYANSDTLDKIAKEPGHPSNFSFANRIQTASDGAVRWWITKNNSDQVTLPDGRTASGRGVYIPEAAGMNRMVYDVKPPAGYAAENNIGTYHNDPDEFPDNDFSNFETHNWHFYLFHNFTGAGQWKTHYEPLFYSAQRQSGGCCAGVGTMGEGPTEPVAHSRGQQGSDENIVWKRGGKTFTVASFDVLSRLYIDHTNAFDPDYTQYNGQYIWFDNIGFASVDQKIERSATWAIQDAASINEMREYPFSITNVGSAARNFHVAANAVSSQDYYYVDFGANEGVYEDSNKNGAYDSGEPKLNVSPNQHAKLSTPLSAGETRHFVLRMSAYSRLGELKTALVDFNEADLPSSEAAYYLNPRYGGMSAAKTPTAAYFSFTFHINTPRTLPNPAMSTPLNLKAFTKGGAAWIVWDEVSEAAGGTLAWYEVEKGSSSTALSHYRIVPAASPGYIDRNISGNRFYRVRAVSTRGIRSPWSGVVQAAAGTGDASPPAAPSNLRIM